MIYWSKYTVVQSSYDDKRWSNAMRWGEMNPGDTGRGMFEREHRDVCQSHDYTAEKWLMIHWTEVANAAGGTLQANLGNKIRLTWKGQYINSALNIRKLCFTSFFKKWFSLLLYFNVLHTKKEKSAIVELWESEQGTGSATDLSTGTWGLLRGTSGEGQPTKIRKWKVTSRLLVDNK